MILVYRLKPEPLKRLVAVSFVALNAGTAGLAKVLAEGEGWEVAQPLQKSQSCLEAAGNKAVSFLAMRLEKGIER